jgi:hypothetical protein
VHTPGRQARAMSWRRTNGRMPPLFM